MVRTHHNYIPRIVIVDSGISTKHPKLKGVNIDGVSIKLDGAGNIFLNDDIEDDIGHGTAVYNIIKKHNKNANIFVIKVFSNDNPFSNEDILIYTLNYVFNNVECDILNLSLGLCLTNKKNELYNICNKFRQKGVIIVSAFDNNGAISYPAAFDNVIGVSSSTKCLKNDDIKYIENDIVNICANGNIQRVSWKNPDYVINSGSSFACAHVTGVLSTMYNSKNVNYDYVIKKLKEICKDTYNCRKVDDKAINTPSVYKYNKVVLFPFNKEMHSLIRFENLLKVNIVDVYDVKYSARVGSTTNHLLKINNKKDYIIKNIENIEWDKFDTFILGHTIDLMYALNNVNYINMLIDELVAHDKYIYSFDDLTGYVKFSNNEKIFYPKIKLSAVKENPFGKLYRYSKPILGVFGTSSVQGKFTLQLKLREELIKKGYNVGQIGTEPTSFLFGMDDCFHCGFNSTLEIERFETVEYINNKINEISEKGVDIIIVGAQSGLLTYETGNIDNYTLPQIEFLLATQPDAIILCINPYDSISLIERTIKFAESAVDCKVIGLVIFPMDFKDANLGIYGGKNYIDYSKYRKLCNDLKNKFNIPVFKLDEELDIKDLIEKVIDFF